MVSKVYQTQRKHNENKNKAAQRIPSFVVLPNGSHRSTELSQPIISQSRMQVLVCHSPTHGSVAEGGGIGVFFWFFVLPCLNERRDVIKGGLVEAGVLVAQAGEAPDVSIFHVQHQSFAIVLYTH